VLLLLLLPLTPLLLLLLLLAMPMRICKSLVRLTGTKEAHCQGV
jgi:hypothetical protein